MTVHLVKTTDDLALLWVENYRDIVDEVKQYPPMIRGELPRGFFRLDSITVEIVPGLG